MDLNHVCWKSLLFAIAGTVERPVLLHWKFNSGAEFQMLLPEMSQFGEASFSKEVEFIYDYEDIVQVSSVQDIPGFEYSSEKVDRIRCLVDDLDGFEIEVKNSVEFLIRPK